MAHVYGHCDFFKNNYWFSHTDRKMMDQMANHGNRDPPVHGPLRRRGGRDFIDACLSIEDLIDIHSPFIKRHDERVKRYDFDRRRGRRRAVAPAASSQGLHGASSSIRREALRPRQRTAQGAATQNEQFPGRAGARRDAVRAGARAAEALAARRAVDHSRRGLLLRPAGPDQDHERRLGQLLALDDHDPPGPRRRPT